MIHMIRQKHDIIFHASGKIELTKKITETLGLKHGDYVNFNTCNDELYIFKSTFGIKLYKTRLGSGSFLRGYNKTICTYILIHEEAVAKYRIGEGVIVNNKILLPIINRINYAR